MLVIIDVAVDQTPYTNQTNWFDREEYRIYTPPQSIFKVNKYFGVVIIDVVVTQQTPYTNQTNWFDWGAFSTPDLQIHTKHIQGK